MGLLALTSLACTPDEIAVWANVSQPYKDVLSEEQLYRLRMCESTDNYTVVDRTGSFRGAYQFNRSTWDSVASRHFHWLVGVDPAEAHPAWQDAMAKALYMERGSQPWPTCGRLL